MRVLKTINSSPEVRKDIQLGSTVIEGTQHQRRGAKTLEKVYSCKLAAIVRLESYQSARQK